MTLEEKIKRLISLGDPETAVHWLFNKVAWFTRRTDVPTDVRRLVDAALFNLNLARRAMDDHKASRKDAA